MPEPAPQNGRASSALAEKLLEFAPDAIVVTNAAGLIIEANPQAEKLFGYTRAELLGLPVETLIPERFRGAHPDHRKKYGDHPSVRSMGIGLELYGRRKDGTEFPVDIMLSALQVEGETVTLAVVRDISERKQIETALQKSEESYRVLVESVKDYAIFMLSPSGQVLNWNSGAERIKGYRTEEIVGQHFSRFYTPEDVERGKPAEELKIAASEGQLEDDGWRLRKDGSRFWANVIITAIRGKNGELLGFSKITRDFTERKNTEQALQISEQRFRTLFEASPDAILATGENGQITEANPQAEKFFGYSRAELAGQPIEMLVPERFRKAHPDHRREYAAHPRTRPMGMGLKLHGRRKDGSEFPIDIMLSTVETPGGKLVLSVIRDLSEAMRAQEELERSEREKRYLEEELYTEHRFEDIIGESTVLRKVLKQVETVAATDVTVLILGETGTGKDLIARAIHNLSSRRGRTLVKLNCAAIPTGLLESELFGHEKGAFTGAISQKIGRLELAHQGTLFLDEIGDLPPELQPKILRALQEKEFERLGGTRTIPVDVRLIAATNRNLEQMVADREFRSDLYYRLTRFSDHDARLARAPGRYTAAGALFCDQARAADGPADRIDPARCDEGLQQVELAGQYSRT